MKKIFYVIIVIGVVGLSASLLYVGKILKERSTFKCEVNTSYVKLGAEAARLSLELAQPYLNGEMYGRCAQRLITLNDYFNGLITPFDYPKDSYNSIIASCAWRRLENKDELEEDGKTKRTMTMKEREGQKIIFSLYQSLESIVSIRQSLDFDYGRDYDNARLEKARDEYSEKKTNLEMAIAKAEENAN